MTGKAGKASCGSQASIGISRRGVRLIGTLGSAEIDIRILASSLTVTREEPPSSFDLKLLVTRPRLNERPMGRKLLLAERILLNVLLRFRTKDAD